MEFLNIYPLFLNIIFKQNYQKKTYIKALDFKKYILVP